VAEEKTKEASGELGIYTKAEYLPILFSEMVGGYRACFWLCRKRHGFIFYPK
jgi:hypothetical protein